MTLQRAGRRLARGFTLVEVLVTIVIVSVLASVLLPALFKQINRGDMSKLVNDLQAIRIGAETFGSDVRKLPSNVADLVSPITASSTDIDGAAFTTSAIARWRGPYLNRTVFESSAGTISSTLQLIGTGSSSFLAVNVTGVTPTTFAELEASLDEGTASTTSSTGGLVRYSGTTMTFLAIPKQ